MTELPSEPVTVAATTARAEWASVLRRARTEPVTITQHGEPVAVVVDMATWREMRAAIEAEDAADDRAAIEGRARIAAGETPIPWEELARQIKAEVTPEILAEVRAELGIDS